MSSKYSDALSHYCYHCKKNNLPDNIMHKVEKMYFYKGDDPIKYQMYVCSDCYKILHYCCVCGDIFFNSNPQSGPGDILMMPECSSCLYHEWDDF